MNAVNLKALHLHPIPFTGTGGVGNSIRCAYGTGVAAMGGFLARSRRYIGFFVALGFVRFVGKSMPTQPLAGIIRVSISERK